METFTYGGKALSAVTLDDGDMLIEGFCALFGGIDRQNEQFAPGSFRRAIKAFLGGPAATQRTTSNRKRNREQILAFARQRIAEDRKHHRPVWLRKIASEYHAEQLRHQNSSTITVGNAP